MCPGYLFNAAGIRTSWDWRYNCIWDLWLYNESYAVWGIFTTHELLNKITTCIYDKLQLVCKHLINMLEYQKILCKGWMRVADIKICLRCPAVLCDVTLVWHLDEIAHSLLDDNITHPTMITSDQNMISMLSWRRISHSPLLRNDSCDFAGPNAC